MIFSRVKKIYSSLQEKFLFSEEPDWYQGLFCLLFSLITIRYIYNKNISIIYLQPYYALPLFEFFHIPDPHKAKDLIKEFFSISFPLEALFHFLRKVFIISMLFSLLGLVFQRFFLFLSLVSFFLFQGYLYGFIRTADSTYVYHSANIVVFILLIWIIAPVNSRWTGYFWISRFFSKEKSKFIHAFTYPQWPRLLIILTIGACYFGSFYCKLTTSGFQWINGYTLQSYLLVQSHINPLSHGYWLVTQNFFIIWFLNIGVWIFQSTAPIGFFLKKTRLLYGMMGILFHSGVFLFFGFRFIPFQYFFVILIPELFQFLSKRSFLPDFQKRKA